MCKGSEGLYSEGEREGFIKVGEGRREEMSTVSILVHTVLSQTHPRTPNKHIYRERQKKGKQ